MRYTLRSTHGAYVLTVPRKVEFVQPLTCEWAPPWESGSRSHRQLTAVNWVSCGYWEFVQALTARRGCRGSQQGFATSLKCLPWQLVLFPPCGCFRARVQPWWLLPLILWLRNRQWACQEIMVVSCFVLLWIWTDARLVVLVYVSREKGFSPSYIIP